MTKTKTNRDGIEIKFGTGKTLPILSYSVIVNGAVQVSHETTRANRIAGSNLQNLVALEQSNNPSLSIL